MPVIDLTNTRFGKLIVVKLFPARAKSRHALWECICDCGCKTVVSSNQLRRGKTKSCGCLREEISRQLHTTHGMYGTPEYRSWIAMWSRCRNKARERFNCYGGRGIKICKRWEKFENFFKDMGFRPANKSLDRKNNNGDYRPSNCRWATAIEQANNRRPRKKGTTNGTTTTTT